MDENDANLKSPIKRLGSTRKLLFFNNIRLQLNEQLRCLDVRMEAQVALVTELQEFFRRRGELELDYSKNLDKLAKSLQIPHKEQKAKLREQWPLFSTYTCWQQLIAQTRNLSRDHVALSEVYSTHLVSRLGQVMEDVQRIYRRCREIGYETHEEILRVLHELHTTMKTYHSYQGECRQAEMKLRLAESQRSKLEQSLSQDKLERSKKFRMIEKEVQKRKNKYTDAKLKALKARNEYILCLEASNTTIHKYFVDDLSDLIDCMDFGFHNCVSRALLMHVTAEEGRQRSVQSGLDTLSACINSLDSRHDKQRFLEFNHQAFMIPKKLEFQDQRNEEANNQTIEGDLHKVLHQEMECRLNQLQQRVTTLRTESEEIWKTLETAEATLLEMLNANDYDCSGYFGDNAVPVVKPTETVAIKLRADRQETEEFYLSKFQEYLSTTTRIARLDSKQEYLRKSLKCENLSDNLSSKSIVPSAKTPRRKRIGRMQTSGQPKLFGGSLEEYIEVTNQDIPLIIKSCIRVINLYGLHHQGIFRVSGSQVEINNFREAFEKGEDPLADMNDASDINSVAGVLKLYLRELREPLFPIIYFDHFMEIAQLESKQEFIVKMRDIIQNLPRPVVVILRYLFAFLNHLSEFADESMMDPYNLAICFGPTLVPVPDDKDQVQYQNQVNELIKNIIMFNDEIFPHDGGIVYEKYISPELEDNDVGESPSDQGQEDMDSEVYPSEDDSENMEAIVQYDFQARSDRELSLKKGDTVTLFAQVSNDWWKGALNGSEGLIPDKYISLKIKDDEKEKLDNLKSSSSEESMRHRASSSNDSIISDNIHSQHNSPLVQCAPVTWTNIPVPENNIPVTDISIVKNNTSPCILTTKSREICSVSSQLADKIEKEIQIKPPQEKPIRKTQVNIRKNNSMSRVHDLKLCSNMYETNCDNSSSEITTTSKNSLRYNKKSIKSRCRSQSPISDKGNLFGSSQTSKSLDSVEIPISLFRRNSKKLKNVIDESNINFNYNKDLWQKRATAQNNYVDNYPVSNIRNRSQKHTPDLVMDLPLEDNFVPKKIIKSFTHSENLLSEVTSKNNENNVSSPPGPESPDMSTAAERFAKQNQSTLKKNTKINSKINNKPKDDCDSSNDKQQNNLDTTNNTNNETTSSNNVQVQTNNLNNSESTPIKPAKPHIKAKPQGLKKPFIYFQPPMSQNISTPDNS